MKTASSSRIYDLFVKTRRFVFALGFSVGLANASVGQTTVVSETRQNPAPWRPSFGSVNQDAIPSVSAGSQKSTSLLERINGAKINGAKINGAKIKGANQRTTNSVIRDLTSETERPSSILNESAASRAPQLDGQTALSGERSDSKRLSRSAPSRPGGMTRVTKTLDQLPNQAGQVWREYDISPYTSQITTSEEPQKAILDWILRETGMEMWFNEPLGILHANKKQLFVYHTPEIQAVVKRIVDRFVWTRGQVQNIDISLVTVENPNWRSASYSMLQPIDVKSPGVEAWMISKENAAILLAQLSKRGDFKRHSSGRLSNHDGQVFALEKTQPVQFVRNLRWTPNQTPNYQPLMTSLDEGYRLTISSLSSIDNETIEAMIKCDVDQVEKLTNVKVNVPGVTVVPQQMNLQVPQLVSWRLHERFRWPNDQVLLLSCGVVATPDPETPRTGFRLRGVVEKPKRADALLFIDYRGPASEAAVPLTANRNSAESLSRVGR